MHGLNVASLSAALMIVMSLCAAQSMPPLQRPQAAVAPLPDALRLELGLSPEQIAVIVRLHEQYRQQTVDLRARAATLQGDQQIVAPVFKKPGLRGKVRGEEEADALAGQIGAAGAHYRSAVRAQLSERQRETLDRLERAASLQRVIEQAECFALLTKTPPDEPAACGQYLREP